MILGLQQVLTADELTRMHQLFDRAEYEPGQTTAGSMVKDIKDNRQFKPGTAEESGAQEILNAALMRNWQFTLAVRPKQMRPALFSEYQTGMRYGEHVDDALMGRPTPMRTDVSFTIFLSPAESYDGGELTLVLPQGERRFKLQAGAMVLYPSGSIHRVEPITRGVRRAAVSWVQSLVRNPAQREMLWDLELAKRALFQREGKTPELDLISKTQTNLLRMWAEP